MIDANALEVMSLLHPLDVKDDEGHSQRMMRENRPRNFVRRPDGLAWRSKTLLEFGGKLFEQLDVLGLLAGELQKSPRLVVVLVQMRADMVEDKGQNELLDQAECVQVSIAPDLIQKQLFAV